MKNLKIGKILYQDHKRKIPLNDGVYINFDASFKVVNGKLVEICPVKLEGPKLEIYTET